MDEFDALNRIMERRYSCRAFHPDPVPRAEIEAVVRTAQKVPSWCNSQPWQVIITDTDETDQLRDAMQAALSTPSAPDIQFPSAYEGVYKDRRRECGWQLYEAVGVAKGDREGSARQMAENFRFFGAPHLALITTPAALGTYGAIDCGAFVTAFTLAAAAREIDTIPQAALAAYAPFFRESYDIPEDRQFACGISFGYGDASHPANSFRTTRAAPGDVIEWRD